MLFRMIFFWGVLTSCLAMSASSLTGVVTDPDKRILAQAEVVLVESQRKVLTDAQGRFQFDHVEPGTVHVQAGAAGYQLAAPQAVNLQSDQAAKVNLVLQPLAETRVTMTVTGSAREKNEVSHAVDVLTGVELDRVRRDSLGDTLADRPGVTSTAFGPTAGRPIIRGMSGDRIRVLEGGLGTGDVSTTSVDHVVTVDVAAVKQVEILRGPATLRYGGSAAGGVVNLLDDRIPEYRGESNIQGELALDGDTVADRRNGHVHLHGEKGRLAWQIQSTATRTDDYRMPGEAELFPEEGEEAPESDNLADSDMDLRRFSVGVSYTGERGHIGFAVTDYRNDYGVPGHEHHHHHDDDHDDDHDDHDHDKNEDDDDHDDHGDEEEHGVAIDLDQKRLDLRGGWTPADGFVKQLRFEATTTDYEHTEGEAGFVGTQFTNEFTEARFEAETLDLLFFDQGGMGIHGSYRDFAAIGQEAFVQPNTSKGLGAYVFQEKVFRNARLNVGARYDQRRFDGTVSELDHDDHEHDHDDHDDDHGDDHDDDDHDHDGKRSEDEAIDRRVNLFNAAVGVVFAPDAPYSLAVNLSHTERAPTAEALFAQGPHIATDSFEIGDPDLSKETGRGIDVSLRKSSGRVTGELSLFANEFDNFIFERFTGEEIDGLRETVFTQMDSRNYGGEAWLEVALSPTDRRGFTWRLFADQVRANLDNDEVVPRMTPRRYGTSLRWQNANFHVHGEVRRTDDQDRVAQFETQTEGFTLVNFSATARFQFGGLDHQLQLRLLNATDEEARIHSSFLKDRVLQPGRNLAFGYRLHF